MKIIFSPWMNEFLSAVKKAQSEIVLISPFIKLSLVKPFLAALPNTSISIKVVTRFNKFVFDQQASDLLALELLDTRPGVPGPTSMYYLNRLHAKCYIFDSQTLFMGSSNLSISGMDRNFEMSARIDDKNTIAEIQETINARKLNLRQIHIDDINLLRKESRSRKLIYEHKPDSEDTQPEDDIVEIENSSIDVNTIEETAVIKEEITLEIEKKRIINNAIFSSTTKYLNYIGSDLAESLEHENKIIEGRPASDSTEEHINAAKRDIDKIVELLIPKIGISDCNDVAALLTPFIHQTWVSTFKKLGYTSLERQRFSNLGFAIVRLESALLISHKISPRVKSMASIVYAINSASNKLDSGAFLSQKGLDVLLHTEPSINASYQNKQLNTILGLKCIFGSYKDSSLYIRRFLEDGLGDVDLNTLEKDNKTIIQELADLAGSTFRYDTTGPFGEEHCAIFHAKLTFASKIIAESEEFSKKKAEQTAAKLAIKTLSKDNRYSELIKRLLIPKEKYTLSNYRIDSNRELVCERLCEKIGLTGHRNMFMLDIALTHQSYETIDHHSRCNIKLAFIGSFVLDVLKQLFFIKRFGWSVKNSELKKDTSLNSWIDKKALTLIFDELDLEKSLKRNNSIRKIGDNVKTDAVQAIFAVSFLWGGFEHSVEVWNNLLENLLPEFNDSNSTLNHTQKLNEILQGKGEELPIYQFNKNNEKDPDKIKYTAYCKINNVIVGTGVAKTKKEAKRIASSKAIAKCFPFTSPDE